MEQKIIRKVIKFLEDEGLERMKGDHKVILNGVANPLIATIKELTSSDSFWEMDTELMKIHYKDSKNAHRKVWRYVANHFKQKETDYENELREQRIQAALGGVNSQLVEDDGSYLEELANMIPVVIPNMLESAKRVVLFNPATGKVDVETDPEVFFMFKHITMKEAIEYNMVKIARLEFNPYKTESSYLNERSHLVLNTYNVPRWRRVEYTEPVDEIPSFISKLLVHLFPEEPARDYVLGWICRAVLDRNQTILSLIGPRGTGKGILTQVIVSLIGGDYAEIAKQSILDDKFNALMKNNRFVCLDEVRATEPEQINVLKAFSNNFVALEQKGRDQQTIRNYNSMMITVNEEDSIVFSPQDRRFSVPEITGVDLKEVFSEKEISSYVDQLENNPEFEDIVQFGNWILKHGKDAMKKTLDNNVPWKFEQFYRIARSNLSEWKLFLEQYIIDNRDEFAHLSDITKEFKKIYREGSLRFPQATSTLSTFLRDYLFEGKFRIGDMDKQDGSRGVRVNPKFLELIKEREPEKIIKIEEDDDDILLSEDLL